MPKVINTSKNRATRTAATSGPAIATRTSQRLASKNGKTDTTNANDPVNTMLSGNNPQPTTTNSRVKRAAKQTRARTKRTKATQGADNDASDTASNDVVEESSPTLNCHPVRNPPESPIKIAKPTAAAAQPKGKKRVRTKAKDTTDMKAPAIEVAAKVKATKKAVKAKTTVATQPATSNDKDAAKKERELRAKRRAEAKESTNPTEAANGNTAQPNADVKAEGTIAGNNDERARSGTALVAAAESKVEENKLEEKGAMRDGPTDEPKGESGDIDGNQTKIEERSEDAEEIVRGGELEVEVAEGQLHGEEAASQEEDEAKSEEIGAEAKEPPSKEPEVEAKETQNDNPEDEEQKLSVEEPVAEGGQPQPEVEQQQKSEEAKVYEEKQEDEQAEPVIRPSQEVVVEKKQEFVIEDEQRSVVEEEHEPVVEGQQDLDGEDESNEEDAKKEYRLNPLKRRRMYDDSDEEDLQEEEEVLRLSAYIATGDSDDEEQDNSANAGAGHVAQGETEIPQSISAFGFARKKATHKKRKMSHESESEFDEEPPVEAASRVEANREIINESDRDQASVVVNAPMSRFDSADIDADEILSGLLLADASDDESEDEDNRDLEYPPSPTAPSTSQGAMAGPSVTRPATPEPEASGSTATTNSSSSSGSSIVYLGRKPATEDSIRRVICKNVPRRTAQPVSVPKMKTYRVHLIAPPQAPPPAGPYRCR